MLKKLTLPAMAVAAVVAFAAPSMASADEWYTSNVKIGNEANLDSVAVSGTLSLTKGGLKFSCNAAGALELWNAGGAAAGRVKSLAFSADPVGTAGCTVGAAGVDVPNCHLNPSSKGFPWPLAIAGTNVVIKSANFRNEFVGAGCLAGLGIPSGTVVEEVAKAEGVTGVFAAGAISFNGAGHFAGGALLDGSLSKAGLELK